MKKISFSVICPTFNNPQYFDPCVTSIVKTGILDGFGELIVVNNGIQNMDYMKQWPNTKILNPGKNLGWEGGLEYGLKHAEGEFVCFQNDDTFIPKACQNFYSQLLWPFQNTNVAAVGPATTVAAGWQSNFNPAMPSMLSDVTYLIFFAAMIRRSYLDEAGGIDTTAPGGDDLDLCMRFRKMGKSVMINPDTFIIHHGFKTGERVKGSPDKPFGWNSKEMTDRTNRWLIQKHGFKMFMETTRGFSYDLQNKPDTEGLVVEQFVRGPKILELGCGYRKTVPQAIGVDLFPKGENPANLHLRLPSVADVEADVTKPLPVNLLSADTVIARHILEHCVDTIGTLKNWNAALKIGGRLIIAVPNQDIISSIPLNPEHVHAFTSNSLKNIAELCGFKQTETRDPGNGISFVSCFEKVLHADHETNGTILETVNA